MVKVSKNEAVTRTALATPGHSPKAGDGVENRFFTSWIQVMNFELP